MQRPMENMGDMSNMFEDGGLSNQYNTHRNPYYWYNTQRQFKLCLFILTLVQINVLNKYYTYNKPIPKISYVKTQQNLFKMRLKKTDVDCEAIRAQIAPKLRILLSSMSRNTFL